MDSYSSLLEAFAALNERKRQDPRSLDDQEMSRWREMRREIEKALFQSEPDPAADTREFLRVPVSLSVRYWTRNELKDRYIPVLGEGGLFVSTVDPLEVGSQIDLEIVLAQKNYSIPVKGQVVWVNQGEDPAKRGMGIKFLDLSYEQKQIVYGLVDDFLHQRLLERRKFARVDARLQVQFIYAEGFFDLWTEDLSMGGLFIATDHLIPIGEKIRMILHIPGKPAAVKAVAEVVRVVEEPSPGQPSGIGVKFVAIDDESEATIRGYLGLRATGQLESAELERRRHPRVERLVKLRFQTLDTFVTSVARDISIGGVFIQTHDLLPAGSEVQITVVHPVNLQKLELIGRVVRVVEPDPQNPHIIPGIGVAFEEVSESKHHLLQEFLRDFALLESSELAIPSDDKFDPDPEPPKDEEEPEPEGSGTEIL